MSISNDLCGIYCIENIDTHKKYIGQSRHIYRRWEDHKWALNNNKHCNDYLQKAWNKYGKNRFVFSVIEECPIDQLNDSEVYYIDYFKSYDKSFGYNLRGGGGQLGKMTVELLERFTGENNPMYGKHHAEETKRKISESRKPYRGENHPRYGKQVSPDTCKKISQSHIGVMTGENHPRHREIYCIELNQIFWGPSEAEKLLGISRGNISTCCSGKAKVAGTHPETLEKLHWLYLTDAINLGYISNGLDSSIQSLEVC